MKTKAYSDVFSKDKYKLLLLDMDGTLYYQRAMQFFMCLEMGAFTIMHPFSLWKLKVISIFRKVREQQKNGLLEKHYEIVAEVVGRSKEEVQTSIEEWMFARPLKYLPKIKDDKLCSWINTWRAQEKKVVIYSDYPVRDKCEALQITADALYSSDETRIGEMKPSAKGIQVICDDYAVSPQEILVIGDRMSRDGKMAENAGADYVIVEKWKIMRKKRY